MTKTIIIVSVALALVSPATAQTARKASSQARAAVLLERAQETASVAVCKVDWLKTGATSSRSAAFFRFMGECIDKQASR